MAGFSAAIRRQQGHAQALQAQAIRAAVWGDAEDFQGFTGALTGVRSATNSGDVDVALAAFGLRMA